MQDSVQAHTQDAHVASQLHLHVQAVKSFYRELSLEQVSQLDKLYHPQALFRDPLHQLSGLTQIEAYFSSLLRNCEMCCFEFTENAYMQQGVFLSWQMHLKHRRLNQGQSFTVEGVSKLRFREGLIIEHHDFFDASQMIFDKLPLIGACSRWLKKRVG